MKKKTMFMLLFFHLLSILNAGEIPDPLMAGQWMGQSKIIVSWCEQEYLDFDLNIDENGRVSGIAGDAIIVEGKIKNNSWILRLLGNTDYILDAKLDGPIIKTENIHRERIKLLLDFNGESFKGEFRSSSSKFGGKENMQMAGVKLLLTKK